MTFLFIALGALFGGALLSGWGGGAVFGALIGAFFARSLLIKDRLRALELKVEALESKAQVPLDLETPQSNVFTPPSPEFSSSDQPELASEFDDGGLSLVEKEPLVSREALAADTRSPQSEFDTRAEEVATAESEPTIHYYPEPNPIFARVLSYFTGGNPAVRIGIVVLFFGVAFLLKYAAERDIFPIEVRLAGVGLAGVALLLIGWRLRDRVGDYGLVLQGGGIGLIYTTVFVALKLYSLIPPLAALLLMVSLVGFATLLAILQNARSLAVLSTAGGFLAPILASSNSGNHVLLFSYYAVLNAGIVAIAWKKSWRILNLIGFVFTFVIGSLWGYSAYRPQLFASTEPFLLLSFVFYSVIGIFFALRRRGEGRDYIDAALIFGTPIIVFALQSRLVRYFEYGLAFSALGFSLFYLLTARYVWGKFAREARMLVEAFVALGVVFATLAIPLAFDARWTSAAWAIEGAGLVWVGARQNKGLARLFGAALQVAAGLSFVIGNSASAAQPAVLNSFFLGCITVGIAGLVSSYHVQRIAERKTYDPMLSALLLVWGVGWWFAAGLLEIEAHVIAPYRLASIVAFSSVSAVICVLCSQLLQWREIKFPAWALLAIMVLAAAMASEALLHPLQNGGYLAWPLAFAAYYWILRRSEPDYAWLKLLHMATLWLLIGLSTWELGWVLTRTVQGNTTWTLAMWGLVPAAAVFALYVMSRRAGWPFGVHRDDYLTIGLWPILIYIFAWSIITNLTSTGNPAPLPYFPVFNPLDLAQFAGFVALLRWLTTLRDSEKPVVSPPGAMGAIGIAAFLWLSAIVVRTLHYWAGVEFSFDAMMASRLVQASLSIFWSLLAFALMYLATRKLSRPVWIAGAGLLAVVVVKLFIVDLSNSGSIERIVTFLAVGVLLVVVGYVSPVPPRRSSV